MSKDALTKTELIEKVQAKLSGQTKQAVKESVSCTLDVIAEVLISGEAVALPGFGQFKIVTRAERKGRNPQTNKEIIIPARKVIKFVPAKAIKDKLA